MTRLSKRPSRLVWKLFLGYAVLIALSLVTCVLLILREFERFHAKDLTEHLKAQAVTLCRQVQGRLDPAHRERLDRTAKQVGGNGADRIRVTFVAVDGTVLGDSQADVAEMDSHRDREEIRMALDRGWGASTRWSDTVSRRLQYVAVRVGPKDRPEGVVRVALRAKSIAARTQAVRRIIWTIAMIPLLVTVVFALALARLWALPIRRVIAIAVRLSDGDLSARAQVRGSDEIARLAQSLNEMRDHLSEQLSTIDRQRQTLEALLNQLQDGVIVAGPDGKIVLSNRAAAKLLHPGDAGRQVAGSWAGRPIEPCVPQRHLQRLLLTKGRGPVASDDVSVKIPQPAGSAVDDRPIDEIRFELPTVSGSVTLLARASHITLPNTAARGTEPGSAGELLTGRVLTLTDITEITRTIQMKTDFVANASHELRTPLSAIRAGIETLLNMNLAEDTSLAGRFLDVVDRHSARLEAIVADLLELSRIESGGGGFERTTLSLHEVCGRMHEQWAAALHAKQLHWNCEIAPPCDTVVANGHLLQLVLDNLVDNAIKFTGPGGRVEILCRSTADEPGTVSVTVVDSGCGIAPEDQKRVFERFYQVGRARSGSASPSPEARGTGLGLSIVRHAVAAMNGTVKLESIPGRGTRVTVILHQL